MGEKNQKNNGGQAKNESENKKKDNEQGKNSVTVVLKTDLHCEGCASKVIKCIRSFDGVDGAMVTAGQKITVVGKVDAVKLREKLEQKMHKKVEVISTLPKEDNNKENAKAKDNNNGGDNEKKKSEAKNKNSKDKSDDKKSKEKEPPVTTAVFKVHLHCEGCIQKIYKTVTKIKGYEELKIDKQKDTVTVRGAMDMKALAEVLKKNLKKDVQIVPPKKENDQEKKDDHTGGDKGKNDGGGGGGGDKVEGNRVQFQGGFPYPFMYSPVLLGDPSHQQWDGVGTYHAPHMFSDENPNACIVM